MSSGPMTYESPTGVPPGFWPGAAAMVAGLGASTGITGERLTGFCSCPGFGGACSSCLGGAVLSCPGGIASAARTLHAGRTANSAANSAVLIAYLSRSLRTWQPLPIVNGTSVGAFLRILFTSVQHL